MESEEVTSDPLGEFRDRRRRALEAFASDLEQRGGLGAERKLSEELNGHARVEPLEAELEVAELFLRFGRAHLVCGIHRPDIEIECTSGLRAFVEVTNLSTESSVGESFYGNIELLRRLRSLPLRITPWLPARLQKPLFDSILRSKREREIKGITAWLTGQLTTLDLACLPKALYRKGIRFDLRRQSEGPGIMAGCGPLEAFGIPDRKIRSRLRYILTKKAQSHLRWRERHAGHRYIIALYLREYFVAPEMVSDLVYGGSYWDGSLHRFVAPRNGPLLRRAERTGWSEFLRSQHLEIGRTSRSGLFFSPVMRRVAGVLVNSVGHWLFLPNPFARDNSPAVYPSALLSNIGLNP